jgi:hypothetical protein
VIRPLAKFSFEKFGEGVVIADPSRHNEPMSNTQSNIGQQPMIVGERHHNRTATRFACNRNWNRRGDNVKSKAKK